MYTRNMIGLITFAVLSMISSSDARSPRIYNVLISSRKNLSPSHAQPVYEPVLRTTSIGYVFPTLIYHTSFIQGVPPTYVNSDYSVYGKTEAAFVNPNNDVAQNIPQYVPEVINKNGNVKIQEQIAQETLPGQFIPQSAPYAVNYIKYLPEKQENEQEESENNFAVNQDETDPKRIIANLKKNSEIPDVPPPPLPVRVMTKQ